MQKRKGCTCDDATCDTCIRAQKRAAKELALLTAETKRRVEQDAEILQIVERGKREIISDCAVGYILAASVKSFADLHDYVDANGYGGAFEESAHSVADTDYWNKVQDLLDAWIKAGELNKAVYGEEVVSQAEHQVLNFICPNCGEPGGQPRSEFSREWQGDEAHGGMVTWEDEGCTKCLGGGADAAADLAYDLSREG